ncbi:hypothetical protein EZS27_037545 [termite gut metagenome]|uniref:CBM6 domain-containing protein n=1 Tax=termite gut metagenome TaxID=433724 RepID=A0A5J4PRP9_9ZZZZ
MNVVDRVQAFQGPHILSAAAPCIIPIRDFDTGGEGYAFHDSDVTNSAGSTYRRDNGDPNSPGVDVQADGAIGYTNAGEWLMYTVQVQDAGDYLIDVNLSANGVGTMHIEVDGENVSGTITLPSNGGWSNWTWRPDPAITVTLSTGKHKVKYYIETANHNINQIRFTHQE